MATKITEDCINCGACEDECPNGAISMGSEIFVIDPALCTECVGFSNEQACAAACPPDVCVPDPEHVESEEILFDRAKQLHPDQADGLELRAATSHFRAG
jgi:ferredoxin